MISLYIYIYIHIHTQTHICRFIDHEKQTSMFVLSLLSFFFFVYLCRVTVYIGTILFLFFLLRSDGARTFPKICHSVSFQSSAILQQCVCVFLNSVVVNFPSLIWLIAITNDLQNKISRSSLLFNTSYKKK